MVASPMILGQRGDLGGDEDGFARVAGLDDFEQVPLGGEALKAPVVQQKQIHPGEAFHEALVCSLVAGESGDQFGDTAVEDGALLAAGLVGERTGNESLPGAGRPVDDQVEGLADPVAGGELGECGACDAASGSRRPGHRRGYAAWRKWPR